MYVLSQSACNKDIKLKNKHQHTHTHIKRNCGGVIS